MQGGAGGRAGGRQGDDGAESGLVRPYALTGGRTRSRFRIGPETLAVAVAVVEPGAAVPPEWVTAMELCRSGPLALAELAVCLGQPLGVAEVVVGDLAERGWLQLVRPAVDPDGRPSWHTLERVLWGLLAAA